MIVHLRKGQMRMENLNKFNKDLEMPLGAHLSLRGYRLDWSYAEVK